MAFIAWIPQEQRQILFPDPAPGQFQGIEHPGKLRFREIRHLLGHILDGPPFFIGPLGDLSTLLVADHRIQCSHQDGITL